VPGALEFLVGLLEYRSTSKSLAVVENAGGILRNMSSFVALHEDHRRTLRRTGVYQLLLRQLGSPSLTVVSNACGTLWNLSARCAEDQQRLRDLGAVGLLRSLVNSKHKMIAMGSTAALKNLLVPRSSAGQAPAESRPFESNPAAAAPALHGRRQRSLDRDFERHSDIADGGPRYAVDARPGNGWGVMSSSAGGNLFSGDGAGRLAPDDSNWRLAVDPTAKLVTHSGAVPSFVDRRIFDSQSVDDSPAVHRRGVSASLDYGNAVRSAGLPYAGRHSASNSHSDAGGFDHLSRRMERVHFTDLPDCSQDEPINFSMKYKEVADPSGAHAIQRSSSLADGGRLAVVPNSPLSRFHVSRQSLPNGRSYRLDFARSQQQPTAGYSKPPPQFAGGGDPQKFAAAYGRSSMDTEQPTNYSLQYAEHYEDDDCGAGQFSEQPIDYSTRYMEPQTGRTSVFRPERDEHCGLYADTVKTFCTEGTPMNYQSTATSLTDLSNSRSGRNPDSHRRTHSSDDLDEFQDFGRKYSELQVVDREAASRHGYPWPHQEVGAYSRGGDVTHEAGLASPGDQPRQYCTEDTPPNFSHSGSLNNLSGDAVGNGGSVKTAGLTPNTGLTVAPTSSSAGTEMASAASFPAAVEPVKAGTGKTETKESAAPGKSVTFVVESNMQVEQTPLMFSRSSSLGSLSSFDVRSVHSSVMSEYSVRASQVVSPSELPDSPGNTMPPSPSAKPPAAFFGPESAPPTESAILENDLNTSSVISGTADISALTVRPAVSSDQSSPVNYCSEGGNMSSRTSLSALTCDGERIQLCKEPRTLPLGEEKTAEDASADVADPPVNDGVDYDDDVDSPINEDDEKRLAECINLGMPPKRRKRTSRKIPQSRSEGDQLRRRSDTAHDVPSVSAVAASASCGTVETAALDSFDVHSPRKFATEDTPLNFSQSGSLSDLSSVGGAVPVPNDTEPKLNTTATHNDDVDSDASLSDDDVPGGDEVIIFIIIYLFIYFLFLNFIFCPR